MCEIVAGRSCRRFPGRANVLRGLACVLAVIAGAMGAVAPVLAGGPGGAAGDGAPNKAVSGLLSERCASCHGFLASRARGSGAGEAVRARGFAGAHGAAWIDLEALSKNRRWVMPGFPDASPLFNVLVTRQMPPALVGGQGKRGGRGALVSGAELRAVRAWIKTLPEGAACDESSRASPARLIRDIDRFVSSLDGDRATNVRFISLVHLTSGCAVDAQLKRWRAGLTYALNSLSWGADSVSLNRVDPRGFVLAFDLRDVGWPVQRWDWLVERSGGGAPFGSAANLTASPEGAGPVPGATVILEADRLARVLLEPAVYYRMLDVPGDVAGLREKLTLVYGARHAVDIGGVDRSALTGAGRVFARHGYGARGYLWEAVDLLPGRDTVRALSDADLLRSFLSLESSTDAGPGLDGRDVAGGVRRYVFRLPNGHVGFMLANTKGGRIDAVPVVRSDSGKAPSERGSSDQSGISDDSARSDVAAAGGFARSGRAGFRCLSCHEGGVVPFSSRLVSAPFAFSIEGRGKPGSDARASAVMKPALATAGDDWRVRPFGAARLRALEANDPFGLSLPIDASSSAVDAIFDLAARHDDVVDVRRGAFEVWVDLDTFQERLEAYRGPYLSSVQRLRSGGLSRRSFDALARVLFGPVGEGRYVSAPASEATSGRGTLSVWADKARYRVGEALVLFAQPGEDCRLTIVGVDGKGVATVLFPNGFARDNLVAGGSRVRIPADDAPYALRFGEAGREVFVAVCAGPDVDRLPLIDHDFDAQLFTVLGDYDEHLGAVHEIEAAAYARGQVPRNLRRRVRSRRRRAYTPKRPSWLFKDGRPYATARTALPIVVRPRAGD